jgi:hypothetical protein
MHLSQLLQAHPRRPVSSVPDWLLGHYKRYSISFANGETDMATHVSWLQSRNFTIDLRLPLATDQPAAKPYQDYSLDELQQLANYEGWTANSHWDGTTMHWHKADATLQLHERWTEPAILQRVGNCMVEFCPSNAYVEDWRLQPSTAGPLIGLRLLNERELDGGITRYQGGGLIICGEHAAWMKGRAVPVARPADEKLSTLVSQAVGDASTLRSLLDVETSVAKGALQSGFTITHSTLASRIGMALCPLDGFDKPAVMAHPELGEIEILRQTLFIDGVMCERIFTIDTLEAYIEYPQSSKVSPASEQWFKQESAALCRYTRAVV